MTVRNWRRKNSEIFWDSWGGRSLLQNRAEPPEGCCRFCGYCPPSNVSGRCPECRYAWSLGELISM